MTTPPLEAPTPDEDHRQLPRNDDAERSLLGAMLLSHTGRRRVLTESTLTAADFFHTRHGLVWDAIVRLDADGDPVDATTVLAELVRTGNAREAGGAAGIHDLLQAPPSPADAIWYADAVAATSTFRRRLQLLHTLVLAIALVGVRVEVGDASALDNGRGGFFGAHIEGAKNTNFSVWP